MPFKLRQHNNEHPILIDDKELIALKEGISTHFTDTETSSYRLMYGVFKSQPYLHFSREEAYHYIESSLGQTMTHLNGTQATNFTLEAIIYSHSPIRKTHYDKLLDSEEVALAALIKAPPHFAMKERKAQAITGYCLHESADPITALPHRKGLFSFTSEETRFTQEEPVTKKNWLLNVNHLRILKEARRG